MNNPIQKLNKKGISILKMKKIQIPKDDDKVNNKSYVLYNNTI